METIKLSSFYPAWTGNIVPKAFEKLCRGKELENDRLKKTPYIVLVFKREYDYDGLSESIDLIERFSEKTEAIHFADSYCLKQMEISITKSSYGNNKWRVVSESENERFVSGFTNENVNCIYLRSNKVKDGSGYNSLYLQVEVLSVNTSEIIGPQLFSYLQTEWEWVNYLMEKGNLSN